MSTAATQPRPFEVTHKSVLALAVPMTLAYLSTPILGLVDTAVIGQLGVAALVGGIAIGGLIVDAISTTFNFLRAGTTGLTAQAYGAGLMKNANATLARSLILAVFFGVLVLIFQAPISAAALALIGGSPAVQAAALDYFQIRVLSAPVLLANFTILGWFLGLGRARTGLALQLFLNGINIALSILFVIGLKWGVAGVAAATVVSEMLTLLLGIGLILRTVRHNHWPTLSEIADRAAFARMMAVNRDIMIRSFVLLAGFTFFTARSAGQGDTILATNAILEKFIMVSAFFLDGLAMAAEQLAGRAVGARYRPAFDRAVRLTLLWSLACSSVLALVLLTAGPLLVDLMTTAEEVRAEGRTYLIWAAVTPLFGVLAFQMDGIFIGATWSRDMRNMMLLSLAIFFAAYYALFPAFQNHGLWLAFNVFLGARGISLAIVCRYRARLTFPSA